MTTLIKNGLVYDGTGALPARKDVLIRGERIARIGSFPRAVADAVVDAQGAWVVPGFVDVGARSDSHMSIFYEPSQEDFLKQGITTIVGGNGGVSLAPLLDGSLRTLREWGSDRHVNVGWGGVGEFLRAMERRPIGVNFGTLAGHTTIRAALAPGRFRDLSEPELEALKRAVSAAIKEGAFGLSFGLEHPAANRVPYRELREIAEVVAKRDGVLATHVRDAREGVQEAVGELLDLAEEAHVNLEIAHFQPLKSFRAKYAAAAERIAAGSGEHRVNFDVNPFDASTALVGELLPRWLHAEDAEATLAVISSRSGKERLAEWLEKNAPRDCVVTHVPDAAFKFLEGRSVKEYCARRETGYAEGLAEIMRLTRLRATVSQKNVDEKTLDEFLAHPGSLVATDSAAFGKKEFKTPASTSSFPAFLRHASASELVTVEKAVQKSTLAPARKYGIAKRGAVKEGWFADIAVLRDCEPAHVFVNGVHAVREGKCVRGDAGKTLRKTD